jgi:hypothetical protein
MISRDHKISGHFALIRQLFQNRRKKRYTRSDIFHYTFQKIFFQLLIVCYTARIQVFILI